jgi:hypothetical protein
MVLEAPVGKSGVHQRVGIPNRKLKELIDKVALLLGERLVAQREGVKVAHNHIILKSLNILQYISMPM